MKNNKLYFKMVLLFIVSSFILSGCSVLKDKINQYSSDKEECILNPDNITEFTYKEESYSILKETVSISELGDWVGYVRKLVGLDETGAILLQQDSIEMLATGLEELGDNNTKASYIISFSNVYASLNKSSDLIIDINGGYHKAVPTKKLTGSESLFDFTLVDQKNAGVFTLNPENATQLLFNDSVYQVTSEQIADTQLGDYLCIIAEKVTFYTDTKKALSRSELSKIDWSGSDKSKRESWFYDEVYEMTDINSDKAVAVNINSEYYVAEKIQ